MHKQWGFRFCGLRLKFELTTLTPKFVTQVDAGAKCTAENIALLSFLASLTSLTLGTALAPDTALVGISALKSLKVAQVLFSAPTSPGIASCISDQNPQADLQEGTPGGLLDLKWNVLTKMLPPVQEYFVLEQS